MGTSSGASRRLIKRMNPSISWLETSHTAIALPGHWLRGSGRLPSTIRRATVGKSIFSTRLSNGASLLALITLAMQGRALPGRVAVKLHSGEPGGHNYPDPALIKNLVQSVNGTIVECNTAYKGKRFTTAEHMKALKDHGFTGIAPVDIMDENGSMALPYPKGTHIKQNYVGAHFANYDSFLLLSHFKGHAMNREAQRQAKEKNVTPRSLREIDFLLMVNDEARIGALRFKRAADEPFLASSAGVPPVISLGRLLDAARAIENHA